MLTIFSTPKPFRGHIRVIQTNAIRSWVSLCPKCEVILFGDEEGTTEIASDLGIRHIPEVERNEYGTPLVRSMFNIAQNIASHELMCYVNADIILMSDFLPAVQHVRKCPFLMVGQRWDLELNESVNFDDVQWEPRLWACVAGHGKLHPESGIDYFVFSRGLYDDIPPFAIGRPGWDNWMIYRARSLKVPVIDATRVLTAVHQSHDYSHHIEGKAGVWEGPEAQRNRKLMGKYRYNCSFNVRDATWILTSHGLKPALSLEHIYFRCRAILVLHPRLRFLRWSLEETILRLASFIRKIVSKHHKKVDN